MVGLEGVEGGVGLVVGGECEVGGWCHGGRQIGDDNVLTVRACVWELMGGVEAREPY